MFGGFVGDACFLGKNRFFGFGCAEVEFDADHALAGEVFEVFEDALIARVVGHDEAESWGGVEGHAEAFDGQLASVVCQGMQYDGGVLAGFDDFVEVADRAFAYKLGGGLARGRGDRWGPLLFRDVLGLYSFPARPDDDGWTDHPTIVVLAAEILHARNRGDVRTDVDSFDSAVFFLLGLYALLTTLAHPAPARENLLTKYVTNTSYSLGMNPRATTE